MVNHEHRASYETLDAPAKLQAQILVKPPSVHYLGADTPYDSSIAATREMNPKAVCLSATHADDLVALKKRLMEVYSRLNSIGATVIMRSGLVPQKEAQHHMFDLMLGRSKDIVEFIHSVRLEKAS